MGGVRTVGVVFAAKPTEITDAGHQGVVGVRVRSTDEVHRVGHGVRPVLGVRVRAVDVVDAGIARVLEDPAGVESSGDGSPQSIVATKSLAGRRHREGGRDRRRGADRNDVDRARSR